MGAPDVPHEAQQRLHRVHALLVDDEGARATRQVVLRVLACVTNTATLVGTSHFDDSRPGAAGQVVLRVLACADTCVLLIC